MTRIRRRVTALVAVLAIATCGLAVSGCGAAGHFAGGVIAHHIANHFLGRRTAGKLFCLYHGHRVLVDLHHHHDLIAGLNAYEAYRACKAGFGHRR